MTPDELAADRKVIDAATPPPWHYDDGITDPVTGERGKPQVVEATSHPKHGLALLFVTGGMLSKDEEDANGRFAAAARTRWPAALDEIVHLRAEVERYRQLAADADTTRSGTTIRIEISGNKLVVSGPRVETEDAVADACAQLFRELMTSSIAVVGQQTSEENTRLRAALMKLHGRCQMFFHGRAKQPGEGIQAAAEVEEAWQLLFGSPRKDSF